MKRFVLMTLALAAGIGTAVSVGRMLTPATKNIQARAQWADVYKTPGGLVSGADLIVIAEHIGAEPGVLLGEGIHATPMTNNYFAVHSTMKGEFSGDELLVEQTGGVFGNGITLNINDGGPYDSGAMYLLFLKNQGNGVYYVINHQARYQLDEQNDKLIGVDPTDPVVAVLHGRTINRGLEGVERRLRMMR